MSICFSSKYLYNNNYIEKDELYTFGKFAHSNAARAGYGATKTAKQNKTVKN